jgi:hypothetical protein
MEQCKGCYRDGAGGCEAFKHKPKPCFAKITDREQYIKEQREIMTYNEGKCVKAVYQAQRNIKRVTKGANI